MRPTEKIEKLIKQLQDQTSGELDKRTLTDTFALLDKNNKTQSAALKPSVWRIIMKNRMTKLATAAVVIIAALLTIQHFTGSVDGTSIAWAKVAEKIMEAHSAVFKVQVGDTPPIEHIASGKYLRQKLQGNVETIIDYEQGKVLVLNPNNMSAIVVDLEGLPQAPANLFERLKFGVEKLKNAPDATIESLGTKEIDGIIAEGIRVYNPNADITTWTDPATNLPVLIEIDKMMGQSTVVFSDFDFAAQIDESMFSLEAPDGYTMQQQTQIDFSNLTEQDLIDGLRVWANVMDGTFPEKLDLGLIQKQGNAFDRKFIADGLSDQEQMQKMGSIIRGLMFVQKLKSTWEYSGSEVSLNDVDKPIFWYKPDDSEMYHVIYADLTVKEEVEKPGISTE